MMDPRIKSADTKFPAREEKMKKRIISLMMGLSLILIGTGSIAADGDLIVNGSIGVGTVTPQAKLDVSTVDGWAIGALRLASSNTTGTGLKIINTDAGGDEWNLISTGSGNGGGAGNLGIYQNNEGYRIYIKGTDGNVGIGTVLPGAKLSLGSGEIGIGQQNDPTNYLRIGMDSGWIQYLANNAYWTGSAYNFVAPTGYGGTASRLAQVSGTFQFDTASGGTNPITWNNRLYIANNGYVGIGTPTPPGANLELNGGGGNTLRFRLWGSTNYWDLFSNTDNGGAELDDTFVFRYNGAVVAKVMTNGAWYGPLSDLSLKENITLLENPVEKIKMINGIRFNYKNQDLFPGQQVGVIADEVEKVVPEAVITNEDGNKMISYSSLIPLLIEAVKEQQKTIDALKLELSAIKR
jgi:hypothetical protein